MLLLRSFRSALISILLILTAPLFSITSEWIGGDILSTNWSDENNWSNGVPNGAQDVAVFPLKTLSLDENLVTSTNDITVPLSTSIVTLDQNVTLNSISLANGQAVSIENEGGDTFEIALSSIPASIALNSNAGITNFDLTITDNSSLIFAGINNQFINSTALKGGNNSTITFSLSGRRRRRRGNLSYLVSTTQCAANLILGSNTYLLTNSEMFSLMGNIENSGTVDGTTARQGSFMGEFTNTSRGKILFNFGGTVFSNGVTNTSRANINTSGATCNFNGAFLNTSRATITGSTVFSNLTFNQNFENASRASYTSEDFSQNNFTSSFTNSGRARFTASGSYNVHHGSYINSSVVGYASSGLYLFGELSNTGTISFTKKAANISLGQKSFNDTVTNSGRGRINFSGTEFALELVCFGGDGTLANSERAFLAFNSLLFTYIYKPIINSDRAQINFTNLSVNTFLSGSSLTNSGSGSVNFGSEGLLSESADTEGSGLQNNFGLGSTITNSGSGNINFYNTSNNFFQLGASLSNTGTGRLQFYNSAYSILANLTNGVNGTISLSNNSITFVKGDVTNNGTISQSGNSILSFGRQSSLAGTGTISCSGLGLILLGKTNTYSGDIEISKNGNAALTGNFENANFFIGNSRKKNRGGYLEVGNSNYYSGNPTANNVTLNSSGRGVVYIYNDTTFDVTGDFTQNNGQLSVRLSEENVGVLNVSGECNLGGSLYVDIVGGYTEDDPYAIITYADDSLNGSFSTLTASNGATITPNYADGGNIVTISIAAVEALKKRLRSKSKIISGKGKEILLHLANAAPLIQKKRSSKKALERINNQSRKNLIQSMRKLQPIQRTQLANKRLKCFSHSLSKLNKPFQIQRASRSLKGNHLKNNFIAKEDLRFIAQPFFMDQISLSDQGLNQKNRSGMSNTRGASFGFNHFLDNAVFLQAGFICLDSEQAPKEKNGKVSSQSIAWVPSVGQIGLNAFFNMSMLLGLSDHQQSRQINLFKINKIAESRFNSLDSLFEVNAGYELEIGQGLAFEAASKIGFSTNLFLPYHEYGADEFNLSVEKNVLSHLLSEAKLLLRYKKAFENFFFKSEIYGQTELSKPVFSSSTKACLQVLDKIDSFPMSTKANSEKTFTLGIAARLYNRSGLGFSFNFDDDLVSKEKKISIDISTSF